MLARHQRHFTACSLKRLAEDVFGPGNVEVQAFGNVLSASAFLYGLAASDLTAEKLNTRDPNFEVTLGLRAVKRA